MENIILNPIGVIKADYSDRLDVPLWGQETTIIEIFPEYTRALLRLEEHSHYWVFCWFNQARRDVLSTRPERIDPTLPEYGVFALRSPVRPNPIALSLVRLVKIDGNKLYVLGMDAMKDTPVLDIKPYFEQDVVFSPKSPNIRPPELEKRREAMFKEAINHHWEDCLDLHLALRMALIAEEEFGKLNSPDLLLSVRGSCCLGDALQGLSKARLANPARFTFQQDEQSMQSVWQKNGRTLTIEMRQRPGDAAALDEMTDETLFLIRKD